MDRAPASHLQSRRTGDFLIAIRNYGNCLGRLESRADKRILGDKELDAPPQSVRQLNAVVVTEGHKPFSELVREKYKCQFKP